MKDESRFGWSWLERWMAARPWETAYIDTDDKDNQCHSESQIQASSPGMVDHQISSQHHHHHHHHHHMDANKPWLNSRNLHNARPRVSISSSLQEEETEEAATAAAAAAAERGTMARSSRVNFHSVLPSQKTLAPSRPPHHLLQKSRSNPGRIHGELHDDDEDRFVKKLVPSLPPQPDLNQRMALKKMKNQRSFSGPLISGGPNYMASTESAMARARSSSNPKIRGSSHHEQKEPGLLQSARRASLPVETRTSQHAPWRNFHKP